MTDFFIGWAFILLALTPAVVVLLDDDIEVFGNLPNTSWRAGLLVILSIPIWQWVCKG